MHTANTGDQLRNSSSNFFSRFSTELNAGTEHSSAQNSHASARQEIEGLNLLIQKLLCTIVDADLSEPDRLEAITLQTHTSIMVHTPFIEINSMSNIEAKTNPSYFQKYNPLKKNIPQKSQLQEPVPLTLVHTQNPLLGIGKNPAFHRKSKGIQTTQKLSRQVPYALV